MNRNGGEALRDVGMLIEQHPRLSQRRAGSHSQEIDSQSLRKRIRAIEADQVRCGGDQISDRYQEPRRSREWLLARNYPAHDSDDDYDVKIPVEVDPFSCSEQ